MLIFNLSNNCYALCSPFFPRLIFSLPSHILILILVFLLCCLFCLFVFFLSFTFHFLFPQEDGSVATQHYYLPAVRRVWRLAFSQEWRVLRKKPFGPLTARSTPGSLNPGSWRWQKKRRQRRKGIKETEKIK